MSDIIIENLFYLGTFPFIGAIFHYFFSSCLRCRVNNKTHVLIIYFLYCLISGGLYLSPLPGSVIAFLNITLLVLMSYFYGSSLKWRIGSTAFIIAIVFLSDALVQSFLMVIFPEYTTSVYVLSLFLSKIVMLLLAHVAVQIATSYGKGTLTGWYWFFLMFCPSISFLGMYGFSRYLSFVELTWLYPTISIGLLLINFFVFILCDHVLQLKTARNQADLLEQQINYYTHQYSLAESSQKETLRFRHDMKNILIGLQAKLETGDVLESKHILNTLLNNISSLKGIAKSGNLVVDSIINYKKKMADTSSISFHLDLRIPSDIKLDSTAISVILGNALDNALEACQQINDGEKYIQIQMHYENESLFICIKNPYIGQIRTDISGRICSTKPNLKTHGIGLKSIGEMVERIHGLLNIRFQNNIFEMEIILFNVVRES